MKFKKTKAAALTLAAAMALGGLTGCALVTTDRKEDLSQVVLEVDITKSKEFAEGGEYAAYAGAIGKTEVLKRDLVASYASYGSTYVNSYGYSVEDAYDLCMDSLVNRAIYLQYAKVYFFKTGEYTVSDYEKYVSAAAEADKEVAPFGYFLDEEERAAAEYSLKVMFNSTLDSQETSLIEAEEDEHEYDTARTLPTGIDTVNEDFCDPAYKIYTGSNSASDCGSYETVDGSTPTTRRNAYKSLLSNLSFYGLVSKGENTSDIASLSYYALERRMQYESALINKLTESFEEDATKNVTKEWIEERIADTVASQQERFGASDESALMSALDSVSDTSFVFYAPENYGFVLNILLPFSNLQNQQLSDAAADLGDKQGNKFVQRTELLEALTATDQRSTWFTSETDYSFEADAEKDGAFYTGGDGERKYLFFENSLRKSSGDGAQYEKIPNYLGGYTYNGHVRAVKEADGHTEYEFAPNEITIDGFLSEMAGYLDFSGLTLSVQKYERLNYFKNVTVERYYENGNVDGKVDYSQFLYYKANIEELSDFDAGKIFDATSDENKAFSVMNELSFAYNTDTAGLNSYLGYKVTPNSTDYVKEFEYAAQEAVKGGAGTITVAPSDYGWHIMYCTFAYKGGEAYTFDWNDIEKEGTFSNLYYNAIKADNFSSYSTDTQNRLITSFDNDACVHKFTERYKDLWEE